VRHHGHAGRHRLDLSGAKSLVPAGDQADAFLVPALANGKMALFIVERTASGVATRGYITQDGSRAAELTLANAPPPLSHRRPGRAGACRGHRHCRHCAPRVWA
jgi:alkylation response protein AidB-like acyl-CoA dehydrogenase